MVGIVKLEQVIAKEGEAEEALAGIIFLGQAVPDSFDVGEFDSGDVKGIDQEDLGTLLAAAGGVNEPGLAPPQGAEAGRPTRGVMIAWPPVPVSTTKRKGPRPLIMTIT